MADTTFKTRPGELKPCPFCGGPAVLERWHTYGSRCRMVSCPDDGCAAGPSVVGDTRANAVAAWNTRYGKRPR